MKKRSADHFGSLESDRSAIKTERLSRDLRSLDGGCRAQVSPHPSPAAYWIRKLGLDHLSLSGTIPIPPLPPSIAKNLFFPKKGFSRAPDSLTDWRATPSDSSSDASDEGKEDSINKIGHADKRERE